MSNISSWTILLQFQHTYQMLKTLCKHKLTLFLAAQPVQNNSEHLLLFAFSPQWSSLHATPTWKAWWHSPGGLLSDIAPHTITHNKTKGISSRSELGASTVRHPQSQCLHAAMPKTLILKAGHFSKDIPNSHIVLQIHNSNQFLFFSHEDE